MLICVCVFFSSFTTVVLIVSMLQTLDVSGTWPNGTVTPPNEFINPVASKLNQGATAAHGQEDVATYKISQ